MKKFGTREEVINGLSKQTRGGLTKQFLKYNAEGKIISIRRRKQRGGVVHEECIIYYQNGKNKYYFNANSTNISYDDYLLMLGKAIYHLTDESDKSFIVSFDDISIITLQNKDTICYLTNVLEWNSSNQQLYIKYICNDNPEEININNTSTFLIDNEINDTKLTQLLENTSTIQQSIQNAVVKLDERYKPRQNHSNYIILGGNPSHIQTGERGGRFVVVGGRRRYLRK